MTTRTPHKDNPETWIERTGLWDIPVKARVLCSDGRYRIARTGQSADTWFSLPARIRVHGKTVSGYVTTEDNPLMMLTAANGTAPVVGYIFRAYEYGKNGAELPAWEYRY